MKNTRAIVTLTLGENQIASWQRFCKPNWRCYADNHRFDLICLDRPLDTSKRAQQRSPAWQKCLILRQIFAQPYERIVWIDADVIINNRTAPDVALDVPLEKVGAAPELVFSHIDPTTAQELRDRMREFWAHLQVMIHDTARDYYSDYGLPGDCDRVINTSVMVLSPHNHQMVLEEVYYGYEEKPGPEWHMEMRPLSYALNHAGLVHWIDPRFNLMWQHQKFLCYPFLLHPFGSNLRVKIKQWLGSDLHNACINTAFQRSYFFHLGAMNLKDMSRVNAES